MSGTQQAGVVASDFVFYTDSLLQQLNNLFPSRAAQTGLVLAMWQQKKEDPTELAGLMEKWRNAMKRHEEALASQRYHEVFADKDILIFALLDADQMYAELDEQSRENLGQVVRYITGAAQMNNLLPIPSLQGKIMSAVRGIQDPQSVNIFQLAESIANGMTEEESLEIQANLPSLLQNLLASAPPEAKDFFGDLVTQCEQGTPPAIQ
eukprot:gnl/Hemi2/20430_TR6782_c0_g1_i1.p1 gnl/Hemi2/20430_TR6782_c0_g1~~gnl/Hemi2/20430_TR6782_c0_g1_i1.p1  ORF type:complete len:222 (+),score=61.86 gnl/Hemi2/20430_TR6782_c0_g1_i1:43-666(+)